MRAILFPGQGSQYVGMGKDLYQQETMVRSLFQEASDTLGYSVEKLCFEDPEGLLSRTQYTQPAILTLSYASACLWQREGLVAQAAAGLSLGEYSALLFAGSLDFPSALKLVETRGRLMQETLQEEGSMMAVLGLEAEVVERILRDFGSQVVIANFNTPQQLVIAGEKKALSKAALRLKEQGAKKITPLSVSAPFHTHFLSGAANAMRPFLQEVRWQNPTIPVYSNVDALPHGEDIPERLERQILSPVLWYPLIRQMRADGIHSFIEAAPGDSLSKMMKRIDATLSIQSFEKEHSHV